MATKRTKVKNSEQNSKKRGNAQNLTPFKKGQSGNPKGRPAGSRDFKTIYREGLKKLAEMNKTTPEELENDMLAMAAKKARSGDIAFYRDTMDRLHGRALQRSELTGKDGGPVQVEGVEITVRKK